MIGRGFYSSLCCEERGKVQYIYILLLVRKRRFCGGQTVLGFLFKIRLGMTLTLKGEVESGWGLGS